MNKPHHTPHTSTKPLAPIRLLPGGRCGCTTCLSDMKQDEQQRDTWYAMEYRKTKEGVTG